MDDRDFLNLAFVVLFVVVGFLSHRSSQKRSKEEWDLVRETRIKTMRDIYERLREIENSKKGIRNLLRNYLKQMAEEIYR